MKGIFDENRNSGDWMVASLNAVADCDGIEDSASALVSMTKALVYASLANAAATRELAARLTPNETFAVQLEYGDEPKLRLSAEVAAALAVIGADDKPEVADAVREHSEFLARNDDESEPADPDVPILKREIQAQANAQSNFSATQRAVNAVNLVEKSAEPGSEKLTYKEAAKRCGVGERLVKGVLAAQRMDERGEEGGGWMDKMDAGRLTASAAIVAQTLFNHKANGCDAAKGAIAWRKRENATWDAAKKMRASLLDKAKQEESERKAIEMALAEAKSDAVEKT